MSHRFSIVRIKMLRTLHSPPREEIDRRALLESAIHQRPVFEVRKGQTWAIGSVRDLDTGVLHFLLGRPVSVPNMTLSSGEFVEEEPMETIRTTEVFLDLHTQYAAVGHNTQLISKPLTAATYLAKLISTTGPIRSSFLDIEAQEVYDTESFTSFIHDASTIYELKVVVSRPNPDDLDDIIYESLEKSVESVGGNSATTTYKGSALDKDAVAKTATAAGRATRDASVRALTADGTTVRKHLREHGSTFTEPDEARRIDDDLQRLKVRADAIMGHVRRITRTMR